MSIRIVESIAEIVVTQRQHDEWKSEYEGDPSVVTDEFLGRVPSFEDWIRKNKIHWENALHWHPPTVAQLVTLLVDEGLIGPGKPAGVDGG